MPHQPAGSNIYWIPHSPKCWGYLIIFYIFFKNEWKTHFETILTEWGLHLFIHFHKDIMLIMLKLKNTWKYFLLNGACVISRQIKTCAQFNKLHSLITHLCSWFNIICFASFFLVECSKCLWRNQSDGTLNHEEANNKAFIRVSNALRLSLLLSCCPNKYHTKFLHIASL